MNAARSSVLFTVLAIACLGAGNPARVAAHDAADPGTSTAVTPAAASVAPAVPSVAPVGDIEFGQVDRM